MEQHQRQEGLKAAETAATNVPVQYDTEESQAVAVQTEGIAQDVEAAKGKVEGKVKSGTDRVSRKVWEAVDRNKGQASTRIERVGRAIDEAADRLNEEDQATAGYVHSAGRKLQDLAGHLRDTPVDSLRNEARDFSRRKPGLFLGGAFVGGVILARLLRASARHH